MKYKYLLLDLDGTLTDPGEGITNSVAYVLEKKGIPVPERRELYKFIGPPLHESFEEYYGFTKEEALASVLVYREYFDRKGIFENFVLPGAADFLKEMKSDGRTLVLATSKPEPAAKRILDKFGLAPLLDYVCGADLASTHVKKADIVKTALEISGASPSEALMIGDRRHDVEGGRANGVDAAGVLFGYGSREELAGAGAVFIADSFGSLASFIRSED